METTTTVVFICFVLLFLLRGVGTGQLHPLLVVRYLLIALLSWLMVLALQQLVTWVFQPSPTLDFMIVMAVLFVLVLWRSQRV